MSTSLIRSRPRFFIGLLVTVLLCLLLGGVGAVMLQFQGPRLSSVDYDPVSLTDSAKQRVVFTFNQPLSTVDLGQVSVQPQVPFTLEANGRFLAVQFTGPLPPDAQYEISLQGLRGQSGEASTSLVQNIQTGSVPELILRRNAGGDDEVVRFSARQSDGGVGAEEVIFTAPEIEMLRASREGALVSTTVQDAASEPVSQLWLVPLDGAEPEQLPLPGVGTVSDLQLTNHQGLFGYIFSSSTVNTGDDVAGQFESALFVGRLSEPGAQPVSVSSISDQRLVSWRAVPQTSRALALGFDGLLWLVDLARPDAEAVALGNALAVDFVEQGASRVVIHRIEGSFIIDLVTLDEQPYELLDALPDGYTVQQAITPLADGSAVMVASRLDDAGNPEPLRAFFVSSDGVVREVFSLDSAGDSLLQLCPSPDGGTLAVTVAPNMVNNPFDFYQRARPELVETLFVETVSGRVISSAVGFDVSWCRGESY